MSSQQNPTDSSPLSWPLMSAHQESLSMSPTACFYRVDLHFIFPHYRDLLGLAITPGLYLPAFLITTNYIEQSFRGVPTIKEKYRRTPFSFHVAFTKTFIFNYLLIVSHQSLLHKLSHLTNLFIFFNFFSG